MLGSAAGVGGWGLAGEGGRGVPRPRPLPKKCERAIGAVVQAMVPDLAQVLGDTAGTHVLDERGVIGEKVVRDVVGTFPHVPAQTQLFGLDPVVRNALVGAPARPGLWVMAGTEGVKEEMRRARF